MTDKINASRKEVRKFGIMFAVICAIIGGYLLYKGADAWRWLAVGSAFFLGTGLVGYPLLKPIYIGWMKFAFVLGWVNTRILLGLFFYLVLTSVGLVLRLLGKDLLNLKFDRSSTTYWVKKERAAFDPKRYERLF
ncbi:MAG: hypothetical protein HY708_07315 [Ignavibacteriae bacterium]|nr:hypothetical protein [Ignavibacteriota bacterium]